MAKKKKSSLYEEDLYDALNYKKESPFDKIRINFKYKNKKQKECAETIKNNIITFVGNVTACGKTFTSLATALELIKDENTPYEKLVCITAPVQVDFDLGALPGDAISGKVMPFASPFTSNLEEIIGDSEKVKNLINTGAIEFDCISFCRGKNFKNSIVIVDEAQQYPESSILTLLTRLCETSKLVFCYDEKQCDNRHIKNGKEKSGIRKALECLSDVPKIGSVVFDKTHIVRNPIISTILSKWDPTTYGYLNDKDVGINAHDLENSNQQNSSQKG